MVAVVTPPSISTASTSQSVAKRRRAKTEANPTNRPPAAADIEEPPVLPTEPTETAAVKRQQARTKPETIVSSSAVAEIEEQPTPVASTKTSAAVLSGREPRPVAKPISAAVLDPTPFLELRILAECYFDTQQNRISCTNRMERGGIPAELFAAQIEAIKSSEHQLELALVRSYRRLVRAHLPGVDEWQKREFGIGQKLLARLLGNLGHPRIATPYHWEGEGSDRVLIADAPFYRTAAQLRSYCGHGDPTRRKRKGMSAEEAFGLGKPQCKMLVHLLAECAIKTKRTLPSTQPDTKVCAAGCADSSDAGILANSNETACRNGEAGHTSRDDHSPIAGLAKSYRALYETRREHTADREDWTLLHKHNDALRIVGKQILGDLWEASA